ncbi:MAG: M3 family oligoendopeptidase [Chloroflexi bacterium]|nr:MAG: M3 family oligoendopeptidase [Chloroflexota bacterium]MBL1192902.1 M3 family oligoendopeptidase [Chloroflexota bacterium]NOH10194.1 M3 family oligoendopeptidase [Chloroflexota bacterium]
MNASLPTSALDALEWSWAQYEPHFTQLAEAELTIETLDEWMLSWSHLSKLAVEVFNRLYIATTVDTNDQKAQDRYSAFLEGVYPQGKAAEQTLKEKLLDSGLQPENFSVQLRNMRAEADLFAEANLPLLSQEQFLVAEHDKLTGAQTVEWEGEEITLPQVSLILQDQDRDKRERAWRGMMARWQQDREAFNELWGRFMELRGQIAANAEVDDYRAYRWHELLRLDYTPEDCLQFHDAIEQVVVPVAQRIYAKRQEQMGLDSLRPWDVDVDPLDRSPLRPFSDADELIEKTGGIFDQVDPQLGAYFNTMREEHLLDLANRKGKAAGGYCEDLPLVERPFIFMNAVGTHDDVQTMLHEFGHALHAFESYKLPYAQQLQYGMEIAEVASMSMELLTAPYLPESGGGFYSEADAARARIEHLEGSLKFWPYMAVVDAFQHWVYLNHAAATDPANCDAKWAELWDRFMKGLDWTGLEEEKATGWHRKLHIFQVPFYYVDYGLAQLGAAQVWANSLQDHAKALGQYRHALSLGATRTLPELFEAAGAKLAFDVDTLGPAVELMETTIEELEATTPSSLDQL